MQLDTTLSLETVIFVLAILAAVRRLESTLDKKLSDQSDELKKSIADVRTEAKSNYLKPAQNLKPATPTFVPTCGAWKAKWMTATSVWRVLKASFSPAKTW